MHATFLTFFLPPSLPSSGFGFVTMADPSVVNVIMQDHLKKKIPKLDGKIVSL